MNVTEDKLVCDVLIIGCGIAGGSAALSLSADPSLRVTVVTGAEDPHESSTNYAQGGIIGESPGDSPEQLRDDLLRAGGGYNNPAALDILTREGPELVKKILIDELETPFTRRDGEVELLREGAHSLPRILHVTDATGKAIEKQLLAALSARENVALLPSHTAVDLLTLSHHSSDPIHRYLPLTCVGAYVLDQRREEVRAFLAKKTVLATGGLGQLFRHTTNSPRSRGDGLAMAYRAGARVINSEFVQFHPTAFYRGPIGARRFLISETVRGSGARLLNARGEAFMERYAPEWKDLAPRDVVARSIHQEMLATDAEWVYLDIASYLPPEQIEERFPTIREHCLEAGVDITAEPIPVVPAAHYFCGGVWVDGDGLSTLRNLYAAGEVSCTGVHGANRLGSSSLLEGLTWGERAAAHIAAAIPEAPDPPADAIHPWYDTGKQEADPALLQQDMSTIRSIMWNYVGLVRSAHRLSRAIEDLRNLKSAIDEFYQTSEPSDPLIGLRNSVQAALIVALAAWKNRQSQGCHYRED